MSGDTKQVWPPTGPGPGMVQGIGPDGEEVWIPAEQVGAECPATKGALLGLDSRVRYLEQAELTRRRTEEQAAQDAANSDLGRAVRAVGGDVDPPSHLR